MLLCSSVQLNVETSGKLKIRFYVVKLKFWSISELLLAPSGAS